MADNGVSCPRFFKVFLSETATESFRVPLSFMEYLHDPLPKTATLQGIGGGFWTVSLARTREGVYFTNGWPKFAKDHELKDGEFLTFVYDGHCTFEVSVFGRCGSKETRAVTQVIPLSDSDSDSDSVEDEEEDEEEEDEDEEEETSLDVDDDNTFIEGEEISQSIHRFDEEEESESDAAVVVGNQNANPHFETTLKNRIYELLIPADVIRIHSLTFGNSITYIDKEGTMEGERGKWSDDRICFKKWDRICRRNKVRKHVDTVACKLLHDQGHVHSIRVHVTRGPAS